MKNARKNLERKLNENIIDNIQVRSLLARLTVLKERNIIDEHEFLNRKNIIERNFIFNN